MFKLFLNTTITTSGGGGFGIFAFNGGTVTANGITMGLRNFIQD
jgi:hypothetical protein